MALGAAPHVLAAARMHFQMRILPQGFELNQCTPKSQFLTLFSATVLPLLPGRRDEGFQRLA